MDTKTPARVRCARPRQGLPVTDRRCTALALLVLMTWTALSGPANAGECHKRRPQVAIIIDDLGYRRIEGLRALALPGPVSYSVLPHSPHGKAFAKRARALERDILLHLPMQSLGAKELGPGGLRETMTATEVRNTLRDALGSVPNARGVSNHMGSHLTAQLAAMTTLMFFVREHQLYFVDSRTTSDSVAYATARRLGVPTIQRDVFLDHDPAPARIRSQFDRLVSIAHRHGTALGVAHPYPSTMDVLAELLDDTARLGIEIVSASSLIRARNCVNLAPTANALPVATVSARPSRPGPTAKP